jgi:hypothetical protein
MEEQTVTETFVDAAVLFNIDDAVINQTIVLRK